MTRDKMIDYPQSLSIESYKLDYPNNMLQNVLSYGVTHIDYFLTSLTDLLKNK